MIKHNEGTYEVLGASISVIPVAGEDDCGYIVLDLHTEECLTDIPFEEYPSLQEIENVFREREPLICFHCARPSGRTYHIMVMTPSGEQQYCCDECWDERLK